MNNPAVILKTLDHHLHDEMQLILYGRAALVLGYEQSPLEFGATMDVDAILPVVEMPQLEKKDDFWDALELTNQALDGKGLYMTHLFGDDQVILSPDWLSDIQPIDFPLSHLRLYRPCTADLILTKMMRVDPQDRNDIKFLLRQKDIDSLTLEGKLKSASIPEIEELKDAFEENLKWLKSLHG